MVNKLEINRSSLTAEIKQQVGRPCKGTYYVKGNTLTFEDGTFLFWGCDCIETDNGFGNYTIGIVELPNGQTIAVFPTDLTFTDKGGQVDDKKDN